MSRKPISRSNDTWLNLLHAKLLTGRRVLVSSSAPESVQAAQETRSVPRELERRSIEDAASDPVNETGTGVRPPENQEPWRRRFWKRGRTRWQRRFAKLRATYKTIRIRIQPTYGMNEDELTRYQSVQAENAERRALNKFHRGQALICETALLQVLKRNPATRHIRHDHRIDPVRFDQLLFNPLEYRYHVGHWPDGVGVMDINNEQVGTDLSEAVGKRVRQEFTYEGGLWICVEVASTMGVPEHVDYRDMLANIPVETRSPLAFPVGKGVNSKRIYADLLTAPHMVVAGASGYGKSNIQNAIACTLIHNNPPSLVKLVMIDMKGGIEFGSYEGVPHLLPLEWKSWKSDGVIFTQDEATSAIEALHAEAHRRFAFLRNETKRTKKVYKSIISWNRNRRADNRIPLVVVFIDEFTTLHDECSASTMKKLRAITNLARAVGIHVVAGSQYPKSEVFDTKMMANFPFRMAFQLPPNASQAVLYDRAASEMQRPGQAIWQTPQNTPNEICVQVPFLPDETFTQILKDARKGKQTSINDMTTLGPDEVVTWALHHNEGRLDVRSIRAQFGDRAPDAILNDMVRDLEEQPFDIDGLLYKVVNRGGNVGRRLVLDDDERSTASADNQPANHKPELE